MPTYASGNHRPVTTTGHQPKERYMATQRLCCADHPFKNTPLGKPKKKTHEAEPLTVPDTMPTSVPEPAQPVKVPVPA